MAAAAILKNRKIAISLQWLHRLPRNLARWRILSPLTLQHLKIRHFKNPRWWRPLSWKSKNRHISAKVWPFGTVRHTGTLTYMFLTAGYRQSKIRPFKNPRWRTAVILTIEKARYIGKGLTNGHDLAVTHINPYEPDQPLKLRTLTLNQH